MENKTTNKKHYIMIDNVFILISSMHRSKDRESGDLMEYENYSSKRITNLFFSD